jgi:hypothetical protein
VNSVVQRFVFVFNYLLSTIHYHLPTIFSNQPMINSCLGL